MFRSKIFAFNNRVAQLLFAIFFVCTYCLGASAQTVEPSGWHEVLKVKFIEGAKELCRNTRGPVASICYQGLVRCDAPAEDIERSISSYGTVQVALLEKGCSWIKLFIAMAPSLGFLGTVIGMVMAFEQIQQVGDINPTIVAAGMKVALITTIFGIIVALVLQLFYNYIMSKIDRLTARMEESAIVLLDALIKRRNNQ